MPAARSSETPMPSDRLTGHRLEAVLVDADGVVGVHAVEVGHHRVDVDRAVSPGVTVDERRERAVRAPAPRRVSISIAVRRCDLGDADAPEEPVLGGAESRGIA